MATPFIFLFIFFLLFFEFMFKAADTLCGLTLLN
jgi:hypothetical protein